tara:strand:+ start:21173 stop:21406 length:234 start_codon:yes stop_codon:yes gene_type:complete
MNPRRRLWLRRRAAENRRKQEEASVTTLAKDVDVKEQPAKETAVPELKQTTPKTSNSKVTTKKKLANKKSKTTKKGK